MANKNEKRLATPKEIEILTFLNDLRNQGTVNMFFCHPNLNEKFPVECNTVEQSAKYFKLWKENFNEQADYNLVID